MQLNKLMLRFLKNLQRLNFEVWLWIGGLAGLYFMPLTMESHLILCPLRALGFDFCPGCGLGLSITWLFHGEIYYSFKAHPLGIPAVLILTARIYSLFKFAFYNHYSAIKKT
jgi:hypothetical protein